MITKIKLQNANLKILIPVKLISLAVLNMLPLVIEVSSTYLSPQFSYLLHSKSLGLASSMSFCNLIQNYPAYFGNVQNSKIMRFSRKIRSQAVLGGQIL